MSRSHGSRPPRSTPLHEPDPLPEDACLTTGTSVDYVPVSVEQMALASDAVVIGRVVGVGAPQWNTEDGGPPQTRPEQDASRVMRLIRIAVDTPLVGRTGDRITAWIPGGTIGCHEFRMDGFPDPIDAGASFAFFIDDVAPRTGLEGVVQAREMWAVTDGVVRTPIEGDIELGSFMQRASRQG